MGRKKKVTLVNNKYEKSSWGKAVPYTSPTGVQTTLYNIATAAEAIGRTPQTLRKWEVGGIIPLTPFKLHGRRMYSTEHIDALVECAEQSHIRPGVRIQDTAFSAHMFKWYEKIYNRFFVENTESEVKEDGKENSTPVKDTNTSVKKAVLKGKLVSKK